MPASKAEKAEAAASAAPSSIPHTPKKLPQSAFKAAEFAQAEWVAFPSADTTFDDVLKREYWAHIAGNLIPDAEIVVKPEARDYWARLIVNAAGPNWASVEVLFYKERANGETAAHRSDDFVVKWVSPADGVKFCVIRKSDNERVSKGHLKEADAWRWLAENEATLANAA